MRDFQATVVKGPNTQSRSKLSCRPAWWQVFGYLTAILPLLFLAATVWMRPDWTRQAIPDWKPVLALADASWEKGDLYEAGHLYLRAGQIATWIEDWEGLVAAAYGMKRTDRNRRPYSGTHTLLIRAAIVAETKQSRAGIEAVAKAFTAMGEHNAASMVLARIRPDWPEEMQDSDNFGAVGCWDLDPGA